MLGPIAVYLGLAAMFGSDVYDAVARGWAIPTATDIAFSYLVGRIVFGAGHPAIRFLLLLAIADDAMGLIILAIAYPSGELQLSWLLLSLAAAVGVYLLFNFAPRKLDGGNQDRPVSTKVRKLFGGLPYIIAGIISWYGFMRSGLHPSLGLLPVIFVDRRGHVARAGGALDRETGGRVALWLVRGLPAAAWSARRHAHG